MQSIDNEQYMKKEVVIDLIEDNRFKEAIDLLKKETRDTHLYHQVILLSASYEDYLNLEITGTEDYSVRSQRRAQLVNGLLHVVDKVAELKPSHTFIELPKIERPKITIPSIELPKINLPTIGVKHLKIVGFGLGLAILFPFLFYFIKNMDAFLPTPVKVESPKSFDLEIEVVKNDENSPYTEGGKIVVKLGDVEEKTVILNAEGKAFLTALPLILKDKNMVIQFEDTRFYSLIHPQITPTKHGKMVKVLAQMQTQSFSGRLVRYDMQPVKNATLDFGNGLAKATTNDNGEYTVNLPKNIGNTVDLSIIENDKVVISRQILVNEKVLSLLKAN
jgi:hypothetical protein